MNASDKCRFGECDGTGFSLVYDEQQQRENKQDAINRRTLRKPSCIYPPYEYVVECRCTPYRTLERNMTMLGAPSEFTDIKLANFDVTAYGDMESIKTATLAKKAVERFSKNYDKIKKEQQGKGLYLWSETKGSGKTMLANILMREIIAEKALLHQSVQIEYIVMVDFIELLKSTFNKESEDSKHELVKKVQQAEILVVDDLGREGDTSFVSETLYSIFNYRMVNQLVTIFTSNIPIEDLEVKYDNDKGRIASRIQKMAFPIQLPEKSIREDKARQENAGMADFLFGGE